MALPLRTVFFSVLLVLVFAGSGFSQKFEYKEYVVKPGDTLWDITKNELRDAFQWPLVWKENLRINNPDLIYPGQVITIPIRAIPQEVTTLEPGEKVVRLRHEEGGPEEELQVYVPPAEEARKLKIVRIEPIITREALLESGYITRKVPNKGRITGSAINRTLFGLDDLIYVRTKKNAEAGDMFYILHKGKRVRHPDTGRNLGYLVSVVGTLVLEESGRDKLKARIIESFRTIEVGDYLDDYYELDPPFIAGEPRKPEVEAFIVSAKRFRTLNGTFDVVFIDKGKKNGLREGDQIMTLFPGTDDMQNSVIHLVNLRDKTSSGVVVKSEWEVKKGDVVVGMR